MGLIELHDGVGHRRIDVPGLQGVIRLDLTGDRAPRIEVPESVTVDQAPAPKEFRFG